MMTRKGFLEFFILSLLFTFEVAHSIGSIGIHSSSFLRSSGDRATNSSTLRAGIDTKKEGKVFSARADVFADTYVAESSTFIPEAREFYVATSDELSTKHRVSLGRELENWSVADDYWGMGVWSPRYIWDPFHPEKIGMTGAFYRLNTGRWSLTTFGSGIAVPERGYPIDVSNGRVTSPSPYFVALPEEVQVERQTVSIQYQMEDPDLQAAVFRPSAAIKLANQADEGFRTSFSYGYLPIHQTEVAVEGELLPQETQFDAKIHTQFRNHHLVTFENGMNYDEWNLWVSTSWERPDKVQYPANWIREPMGPAFIFAMGSGLNINKRLALSGSLLKIYEDQPASPEGDIDISLPSRFRYKSATTARMSFHQSHRTDYASKWTYDIDNISHLLAFDWSYRPSWKGVTENSYWQVGLGVDFIISETREGWFGQYRGDDRLRGRLTYVF